MPSWLSLTPPVEADDEATPQHPVPNADKPSPPRDIDGVEDPEEDEEEEESSKTSSAS